MRSAVKDPTIPDPRGFNKLSRAEQIRYLQFLWDRIAHRPEDIPVPESHIELAEHRLAGYRSDPSRAQPAYDGLDNLMKKRQ
jgi:putative addiction module component (TIGR02574 family)